MHTFLSTANRKPQTTFTLLLLVLCFLLSYTLSAQNTETAPRIEVTGNAEIEVIPNVINVQITLKEYLDGQFKVTVSEQETKMRNMLKIAGVDLSKLNLANENADFVTVTKKNRYEAADKTFILTVSSPYLLTNTFQVLNGLNIKDAKVISVTHSKMDSLRQAARIMALQDAKTKANSLIRGIGNRLAKPLVIKEVDFIPFENDVMRPKNTDPANTARTKEGIIEDEYTVEFKKIKIQSAVFVRFAIE